MFEKNLMIEFRKMHRDFEECIIKVLEEHCGLLARVPGMTIMRKTSIGQLRGHPFSVTFEQGPGSTFTTQGFLTGSSVISCRRVDSGEHVIGFAILGCDPFPVNGISMLNGIRIEIPNGCIELTFTERDSVPQVIVPYNHLSLDLSLLK